MYILVSAKATTTAISCVMTVCSDPGRFGCSDFIVTSFKKPDSWLGVRFVRFLLIYLSNERSPLLLRHHEHHAVCARCNLGNNK